MTTSRRTPKPKAAPAHACAYCYGKGLSLYWKDHGARVPIGGPLTNPREPAAPCDRCGQPVNNGQKRTYGEV